MIDEAALAYGSALFADEDDALRATREGHAAGELPSINVSPEEGKLLFVLMRAISARRVLEVGTLGGYSGIWLARALPDTGRLVTIEGSEKHAAFATNAFRRAGVADRVELIVGEALDTLQTLEGPFDAVFLDADKAPLPEYLTHALRLLRPGGLLLCDNTYMGGRVVETDSASSDVRGMRTFNQRCADDPRLTSVVIPVRDGLLLSVKGQD